MSLTIAELNFEMDSVIDWKPQKDLTQVLPSELVKEIFQKLRNGDILKLRLVSKNWKWDVDRFEWFWKELIREEAGTFVFCSRFDVLVYWRQEKAAQRKKAESFRRQPRQCFQSGLFGYCTGY